MECEAEFIYFDLIEQATPLLTFSSLSNAIIHLQPLSSDVDDMFVVERVDMSESTELMCKSEMSVSSVADAVSLQASVEDVGSEADEDDASEEEEEELESEPVPKTKKKKFGRPKGRHDPATCHSCIRKKELAAIRTAIPVQPVPRTTKASTGNYKVIHGCFDKKKKSAMGHFDFSFLNDRDTRGVGLFQVNKDSDTTSC